MLDPGDPRIDFNNTEIAFSSKSNRELKKTYRLFKLMNNSRLVQIGSFLGNIAAKLPFGIADPIIEATVFYHFCGGTSLLDCQKIIDSLNKHKALTILDYGVEAKDSDDEFEKTLQENLKAVEFAYSNPNVPVISTKLTGYISTELLEKIQSKIELTEQEKIQYNKYRQRFIKLCEKAHEFKVGIFVDAEESWIQQPMDDLVEECMQLFNKETPIVYNTYQMYRHDRLDVLKSSYEKAKAGNYILGAKIVRGAYMEKERKRALEMQYESPIQISKEATDKDYDEAIDFTLQYTDQISMVNASHNWKSNELQVDLIKRRNIPYDHPHVNFCQLLGMSDNLTFNLATQGYNVAKYVPYGPVKDVLPYLIRRAQENSSVSGDMSRELQLLHREMVRRGLLS
ncbi:MAG: proline dehydrogenase [Saprospiraceae bacterium]|nr:proline dehydrogenase [Saprospiraceae bacterium]